MKLEGNYIYKENSMDTDEVFVGDTFFDMIDKSYSESVHSAFLAWILTQEEWLICQDRNLVLELLRCVSMRAKQQDKLGDEYFSERLIKALDSKDVSYSSDSVDREYPLDGFEVEGKGGSVDLHIKGQISLGKETFPIRIIVENKIYSNEFDNQTCKYYAYFSNDFKYLEKKALSIMPVRSILRIKSIRMMSFLSQGKKMKFRYSFISLFIPMRK